MIHEICTYLLSVKIARRENWKIWKSSCDFAKNFRRTIFFPVIDQNSKTRLFTSCTAKKWVILLKISRQKCEKHSKDCRNVCPDPCLSDSVVLLQTQTPMSKLTHGKVFWGVIRHFENLPGRKSHFLLLFGSKRSPCKSYNNCHDTKASEKCENDASWSRFCVKMGIFVKSSSKFVVDTHPISHCFETSLQFHARFSFRHVFLISFLFVFLKIPLFFGLSNFP